MGSMDIEKARAWVQYDMKVIRDNQRADWQRQRRCKICRLYAGDKDDGLLGSLFCHACGEYPDGCRQEADAGREARWIEWAARKLCQSIRWDARDAEIRASRAMDGNETVGRRVLG